MSLPVIQRSLLGLAALVLAAPAGAKTLEAQATEAELESPQLTPTAHSRGHVLVDSATVTVGFALHLPVGSASDPRGEEGTMALLAAGLQQVLEEQTRGVAAEAEVGFDRGGVTVLGRAAPEALRLLVDAVRRSAFERPLPVHPLEKGREALAARLRFESGAPVRSFQSQTAGVVFRSMAGWNRPVSGTEQSVAQIDLDRLASSPVFSPAIRASATAAIVGPVDVESAHTLLGTLLGPDHGPPDGPDRGLAWIDGERREFVTDITATWVAVALPVHRDVPTWKIELLAHHITEVLRPDLPRAGLVSPEVRLIEAQRLPVILITFAIAPELSDRWVERVLATARLEADAPPDERFFRWQRRRFRTTWLTKRAQPEQRAARLARGWDGQTPQDMEAPFATEVWRTDLEDAARALGGPRILVFGPDLGGAEAPDSKGLSGGVELDHRWLMR